MTQCTVCSSSSTWRRPRPSDPADLEARVRAWYPTVADEDLSRIGELVRAYTQSALATRIAELGGARPERPFAFELDGVLVNGRLDVLWRDGEMALVLDYKTNALLDREPAEIVAAEYLMQQTVYAIACLRAGAREVEVVYHFLEDADAVVSTVFTRERHGAPRGAPLGIDRPHPCRRLPADAERVRVLRVPGARRRLRRASAGRSRRRRRRARLRLGGVASAPCGSQRCTTSTGTDRHSKRCWQSSSRARAWTRSSSAAMSSGARCNPSASTSCSRSGQRSSRATASVTFCTRAATSTGGATHASSSASGRSSQHGRTRSSSRSTASGRLSSVTRLRATTRRS